MATKQRKNYFDIRSLISKGIEDVREYDLNGFKILIRPLSDIESDECESILLSSIKDKATREFVFNAAEKDTLTDLEDIIGESDEEEDESKKALEVLNSDVDYSELMQAFAKYSIHTVYLSIRDFTDSFKEEDLRKVNGIKELAAEIQRISGHTKEVVAEIEEFR